MIAGCNFSFGSNKIDPKKVEKSIKTSLDSKLAGKLDGKPIVVECPKDEVIKEGATFDCAVTAGDHKLVAKITQEDSKGTIAWEITEGLIDINFRYGTDRSQDSWRLG